MGKGDKKTKRGKIHIGSTGVKRQKKKAVKNTTAKVESPAKAAKKAAPKKAAKKAE